MTTNPCRRDLTHATRNTPVTHTRHARLRAATATMFIAVASILINMCAQPFCRVRTFRMSDGLPSHNISRITQDPDDLLWVATWGGLTNFDGRRFLVYRSGPRNGTLPTNRITSIWPDSCGRIWLHLYGELPYYLDTATGSFIPVYEDVERKIGGGLSLSLGVGHPLRNMADRLARKAHRKAQHPKPHRHRIDGDLGLP